MAASSARLAPPRISSPAPQARARRRRRKRFGEFCKGKIAHFKVPQCFRFVDAFPIRQTEIKDRHLEDAAGVSDGIANGRPSSARLAPPRISSPAPQQGETATVEEIREFCKGKIAHFKVPQYCFVDAFPMVRDPPDRKSRIAIWKTRPAFRRIANGRRGSARLAPPRISSPAPQITGTFLTLGLRITMDLRIPVLKDGTIMQPDSSQSLESRHLPLRPRSRPRQRRAQKPPPTSTAIWPASHRTRAVRSCSLTKSDVLPHRVSTVHGPVRQYPARRARRDQRNRTRRPVYKPGSDSCKNRDSTPDRQL